jgi:hypothetical protein
MFIVLNQILIPCFQGWRCIFAHPYGLQNNHHTARCAGGGKICFKLKDSVSLTEIALLLLALVY